MEEPLKTKLIMAITYLKNQYSLIRYLIKMKCWISAELPEVKVYKVSLKDSVLNIYKRKPIEVTEE